MTNTYNFIPLKKHLSVISLCTASLLLSVSPAVAEEATKLDELVVSGGLTPVEKKNYGRASTVLTEKDIQNTSTKYLVDVLRRVPGVSVSRSGSFGGLTQVRMRGHEGNHTLVLIDGIEVAAPNQGEYDFGGLLASDIERIEVLRGPQSSLYGSQAIGGVISITTKSAKKPGLHGDIGVEAGTDETKEIKFGVRYKGEKGSLSLSGVRRDTGGFDISDTPGGQDDGDLNRTINLKGRYFINDNITVGGTIRRTNRKSDTDVFNFAAPTTDGLVTDGPSNTEVQETFGLLFTEIELFDGRLQNRVDFSFADINRQGRNGFGNKSGDNTGTREKIAYKGSFVLDANTVKEANHILTFAAEKERLTYQENDPNIVFNPGQLVKRKREQEALILEYQGNFDFGLSLQASVRQDFNDKFEDFTTYALGASYLLPNTSTRFHASYGTGVQNPTLIEQFGFFSNFVGNPDLEPEQSKGWDIGVEQKFFDGRALIDVTYFKDELTDEIGTGPSGIPFINTPVNRDGKSDRQGIEVATRFNITDRLTTSLNYTWLDASEPVPDVAAGSRDAIEVRRPEHEISFSLDYLLPNDRTRLHVNATHVSGLYDLNFKTAGFISGNPDDNFDRVKLDDYLVVNLGLSHEVNDKLEFYGRVSNLFDEDYEELEGYATQGRTAYVGVRMKLGE